ncbi:MAG: hypothetical protein L6R39_003109 [Caloplaca ligustica]|nr:MAG: hypothetical protein L6R39_003109 [Caloplaca ligustica]
MSCQRRIWRYTNCEHEEEMDLSCTLAGDADHIHSTVVVQSDNPPSCTICYPPGLPAEYQARNLQLHLPQRHLGGPLSPAVIFRGTYSETQPGPSAATNGATVNGATVDRSRGNAPPRINDTTANLPWATHARHNQPLPPAPRYLPPQHVQGVQQDPDNDEEGQKQPNAVGAQQS